MINRKVPLVCCAILLTISHFSIGQVQTGVWRSTPANTDYHHFVRNGGGAAVYINQESTASNYPILRLSSGTAEANRNVRFTVENNGNVGIGTLTPKAKMEIKHSGTIGSKWNPDNSYLTIADPYQSLILDPNEVYASGNFYFGTNNANIYFRSLTETTALETMTILADGRVGIGTTKPDSKLSVKGNIRAQEVKVETANWADHVFLPDYPLMPLLEVESYIQDNGHLPNIPTEAQVQQDGIHLGEMNAKLLEKVEELTLYLIEQEKTNQEQAKLLVAQQKILEDLLKKIQN